MKKTLLELKLTQRDEDILTILWNSGQAMTASQIVEVSDNLTINTVQAVLRKLLRNKLIKIDDIVYSGTVLSRSYVPVISAEDYAVAQLTADYKRLSKQVKTSSLFAAFLDMEMDTDKKALEIEELEQILQDYKTSQRKPKC